MHQKTIVFAEPIDALSVRLPHDDTQVAVMTDDGWHQFFLEKEFDPYVMESDLVIFPEPTTEVIVRGQIDGIHLHPITVSKEPPSYKLASRTFYRSPRILARQEWGANDEFLYRGPPVERSDLPEPPQQSSSAGSHSSKREQDCKTAQRDHPQDFKVSKTVTHDANGERLRWARRYSPEVDLLVVHHTGQRVSNDTRPAAQKMRALYEYHANSLGWGDIGYHYVINDEGSIYQGRSGGDAVVGGHVYCGNVKTVGIAMMGNFEEEKPTLKQIQSLQWLLQHLADKYDIDLQRKVSFHGKSIHPITRHKDINATECPGYYVTNTIAQIRDNVIAGNINAGVTFPRLASGDYESRSEQRLAARLQKAGQELSRRFYRVRRQTRTAERLDNSRLQYYRNQLAVGTDLQRQRSARQQQPMRPTGTLYRQNVMVSPSNYDSSATLRRAQDDTAIRIRLSYTSNNAEIRSDGSLIVNGSSVDSVRVGKEDGSCIAITSPVTNHPSPITRIDSNGGVLTINTWKTKYNRFRGTIECRVIDGELVLINELPLEDYMKGISEQPDTEPREKQKAFAVAARSYAAFYMESGNEKFPGKPYHGSDTGVSFQSYTGISTEEDNPKWVQGVLDTKDLVIKKDGGIVKTAYYSSNDGRTRSPEENGWRNFPYAEVFASKPDPHCTGFPLHGHGVGMSGCGSEGMARQGKRYTEILEYYYPGTVVTQLN